MMKMSGRVTSCCVALFLALTSVSAVQSLHSINALKKINFGQYVPKHSLVLLHWFANTVDIDNTNVIRLTFDPNSGDYGSHHYGNYEGLLDPLPWGYRYYTIGNLNQGTPMQLPSYVVHPPTEYMGGNRDRIIIRVMEQNTGWRALQRIDQVYITQHYETSEHQGTVYDPAHTYQITTNLLRQIREFSVGENQQTLSYLRNRFGSNADDFHIRNTWGDLACLGLLLFIVFQEKYSSNQHNRPKKKNRPENRQNNRGDDAMETVFLREEMRGRNVTRYCLNQSETVVFLKDDEDHEASRTYKLSCWQNRGSCNYNTSKPLNDCQRLFCFILCFAFIYLILLCTILAFL